MNARFDGETFDPDLDGARLTSQLDRVKNLMRDGKFRTLKTISLGAGGSEASVSARLRDMRKARFGACTVERKRLDGGLWMYRWKREPAQMELI